MKSRWVLCDLTLFQCGEFAEGCVLVLTRAHDNEGTVLGGHGCRSAAHRHTAELVQSLVTPLQLGPLSLESVRGKLSPGSQSGR